MADLREQSLRSLLVIRIITMLNVVGGAAQNSACHPASRVVYPWTAVSSLSYPLDDLQSFAITILPPWHDLLHRYSAHECVRRSIYQVIPRHGQHCLKTVLEASFDKAAGSKYPPTFRNRRLHICPGRAHLRPCRLEASKYTYIGLSLDIRETRAQLL